jgi:hypothetical protein
MKKLFILLAVISLIFTHSSCEDALTFDFSADFPLNMNIDIQESKSNSYPFSESKTLNIEDEEEVMEYIENIKEIDIVEIECTLTGIPTGETISELNIIIEQIGLTIPLVDLTENSTFILPVSPELLDAFSLYLYNNHQTTVNVTGISSYAPMTLGVKLLIKSNITATL